MSKERFDCLYNDCVVRGAWEDGDCIESTPDLKDERIEFFSIYLVKADTGEQDWIADFGKRSSHAELLCTRMKKILSEIMHYSKIKRMWE